MNIIFCVALLALLVYAVSGVLKKPKWLPAVRLGSCAVTVIASLAAGLMQKSMLSLGIGVALCTAISFLISLFSQRIKGDSLKAFALYMAKALAFVLLLEAVVFNFNCYHLYRGGYEEAGLNLSQASVSGFMKQGDSYVSSGESASVEFTSVGKRIGTIRLDLSSTDYKTDYAIDFADETNASYRIRSGLVSGSVYSEIDATQYVVCDFSGAVSKLRIRFDNIGSQTVTLRGVTINEAYPSYFNWFRVILLLLGVAFVWLFKRSVNFRKPIGQTDSTAKSVTAVLIAVAIVIAAILGSINIDLSKDFSLTTGNQLTKEQVDALEKGQIELLTEPSDQLLDMENPYDWSARLDNGVSYLWDHVLYNGKYYSYYGSGPVFLLFLPYHLITGHYFPSGIAGLLFNALGLIFIGMTFYLLMKKLFKDLPLSMYTAALVMIFAACGVWYCTVWVNFYELAQSSGFAFVAMGAYFLVSSNVIGEGKIRPSRALLSSLFLALAVTCRPTTAVWCVAAVAFIVAGVLKLKREEHPAKGRYAVYLVCALAPFAVIGGLQVLYNYIRFGSFTDFGIAYSLTINDFTHTEFHTQLAAIGFFDYLFAPPSFSGSFPYVQTTLSDLGVNGYYFVATRNGVGLLFRALPMFFLFAAPFALKRIDKKRRVRTAVLFSIAAFVAPCIVIASIWESGYGARYMMDFAWQMLTCALIVMFFLYRELKSDEAKRIYEHILLISMFLSLAVCVALTYSYCREVLSNNIAGHEASFERFARMFSIFNT